MLQTLLSSWPKGAWNVIEVQHKHVLLQVFGALSRQFRSTETKKSRGELLVMSRHGRLDLLYHRGLRVP